MVKTSAKRLDLVNDPIGKSILLFALPIMLGQLLQQLYSTVDGIIVGNFVSPDALAAMGSCISYAFIYLALAIGLSNGSGVVVAQFYGAGKHEDVRKTASTILILLFAIGAAATIICVATVGPATKYVLKITDADVRAYAVTYISIYALGFIFQFVYNAVSAILRSVGDSKAVLYFLLVATVINTVLDIVFVTVFHWGIAGAAIATVISQIGCVAASIHYMFKHYPQFRFTPSQLVFDKHKFKLCLKMGIPTTIQHLIISSGHVVMQRLVNSFGKVTMAAFTVGSRYDHYCSVPVLAIMQSVAAFTGQNTGAGRLDRVKKGLTFSVIADVLMVAVLCTLMYIFARPLATLFGVEVAALDQSVEYLRFMALCYPLFAMYIPINGLFQGCGDPISGTITSLIALSTRVIASYAMVYFFNMGYAACWQSYMIGWGLALLFCICRFATGRWKTKALVRKNDNLGELAHEQ